MIAVFNDAWMRNAAWTSRAAVAYHIDGLVQDCSNSIANVLELL